MVGKPVLVFADEILVKIKRQGQDKSAHNKKYYVKQVAPVRLFYFVHNFLQTGRQATKKKDPAGNKGDQKVPKPKPMVAVGIVIRFDTDACRDSINQTVGSLLRVEFTWIMCSCDGLS